MVEGFCQKCGYQPIEGKCECKPVKKVLVIYFNNGMKKQIHSITEEDIETFIKFAGGMARYRIWDYKTTNLRQDDEIIYIPYQSVSFFEVREVTE